MLLFDAEALKNPGAHVSHFGRAVLEPAIIVYFPGGHLRVLAVTLGTSLDNMTKIVVNMSEILACCIV